MVAVTTLATLLAEAADRDSTATAIIDGDNSMSWAEAATQAGKLANTLGEIGVRPGDRVGVHTRKSAEGFLAMHGVVAAGAIAVPLDAGASPSYLQSVAAKAGCSAIISHERCRSTALSLAESGTIDAIVGLDPPPADDALRSTAPGSTAPGSTAKGSTGQSSKTRRCRFVGPDEVAAAVPLDRSVLPIDPTQRAYIITTSGSTGTPKGICHTHASALAYVAFKQAAYDFGPDDRISDLAPNHFDISTLALWVAPAVGAAVVIVPETHQLFPASLSSLMADTAMTVWYGVPYSLLQLASRGALEDRDLRALRWVLFGGEVMAPLALADLMGQLPGARFSNVYGPAEVNACAVHHLDSPPANSDPIAIGRPIGPTELRLVEPGDSLEPPPVSAGEHGEIWVSADTMMEGYWEEPATNSRVIVEWDDHRWYRTGDLGFERPDGELVFSGRVDHQVKVRGYRVELESIESVLEDCAGVSAAVANVARDDDGSDVIVAGILSESPSKVETAVLTSWAQERLPHYSVPSRFYKVGSTPVTGSGKLDRRAMRSALADTHRASVERT
ncbi:MAG: AMP-binding protein [Acidimicrobiales bacterium]